MHQPADVCRQLLCFGAGQQHAVIQRMQISPLGNPALVLDQILVHDRDLTGGPAEADKTEFEPIAEGLTQRHGLGRRLGRIG